MMELNPYQHDVLINRLCQDYEFKDGGDFLVKGVCPYCHKRELFISKEKPYRICCNRRNKCSYSASVFELYKHSLFANWSQQYPVTPEHPSAAADAYMHYARGFAPEITQKKLYSQEYYCDHAQHKTATVRFTLSDGQAKWERFIDDIEQFDRQKGRAIGSYKGLWWQMPEADFSTSDSIWITEGIFDALALHEVGQSAIACISCGHYPEGFFKMLHEKNLHPTIVWALDNDTAGSDAVLKHVAHSRQDGFIATAALPPPRRDWNDLLRSKQLNQAALDDAKYRGKILLAESALELACLMYSQKGINSFACKHNRRTYWFNLDVNAYQQTVEAMKSAGMWHDDEASKTEAVQQSAKITEIANCTFTPLYFQRDRDTDDAYYFVRIQRPNGLDLQSTFTGNQLAVSGDFKKRLLSICPGALYEGNGRQLDRIIKAEFGALRSVETIDYVGYVKDLDAWIYRDFAVCNGKIVRANDEQFIELDGQRSIKTVSDIKIELYDSKADVNLWLADLWCAFRERGMVALSFFTGSLFAEQIRSEQKSWPFLEITGDAGTGKTTLIEFLWRLLGRSDYEGFDPGKSSFVGRARAFNKVSNLPVVLIESDHHASHNRKFEFGELKDLYNGRPIYTRGMKTLGLETYDPPFRGTVVIAQNEQVEADEAVLSRIVPLFFNRKDLSRDGKHHVDRLNSLNVEQLAPYLLHILKHSKTIMADYRQAYASMEQRLLANPNIMMTRIVHNGAQIMAMMQAIAKVIGIDAISVATTLDYIEQISVIRQQSMSADHPIVTEFWDSFEYLLALKDSDSQCYNHSTNPDLLALNLPQIESAARIHGISLPLRNDLNRLLPKSKRYEFIARKNVWSASLGKAIKCLVFKNPRPEAKESL